MTFAEEIEDICKPETIEAIVVGAFGWGSDQPDEEAYGFEDSGRTPIPQEMKGKVLEWEQVRKYLDYNYYSGFGSADCHAITVWTPTRVIGVDEYDGSTGLFSMPRHPSDHTPSMPGGG